MAMNGDVKQKYVADKQKCLMGVNDNLRGPSSGNLASFVDPRHPEKDCFFGKPVKNIVESVMTALN